MNIRIANKLFKKIACSLLIGTSLFSCSGQNSDSMNEKHKHTNLLIHESSPYLQQHAHNPVNWYPWGEAAWEKAKKENKLVLISIGYSSCHWCHVMERESFENEATAALMNEHYVCIKVDREERPDVDQVYMTAVQLMTGSGGWPLNCFTLPDGRPIYGGTYYPNENWNKVLMQLHEFYRQQPEKAIEYAEELSKGISHAESIYADAPHQSFDKNLLADVVSPWKKSWDREKGGPNRAPKFPLPNNYEFLLQYGVMEKDNDVLGYVEISLDKMADGGIYDQIGGGFARYSTDIDWKVPHFEKMLYDNAQLLSLYAQAYRHFKKPRYREIVFQTIEWMKREMSAPEGGFYAALDADSEGEEGKFYTWKEEELKKLLAPLEKGKGFSIMADVYSINKSGYWEHGNYILLRSKSIAEIATKYDLSEDALTKLIDATNEILLRERNKRIRPGLDDKIICSWNALAISGLCQAYKSFGRKEDLLLAEKTAQLLFTKMQQADGSLFHTYKNNKATINAYLDDYAFSILSCIELYECTFQESWLQKAQALLNYTLDHFHDEAGGFFWYTSDLDPPLIARKKEIMDNVIPGSNSAMARALQRLAIFSEKQGYTVIAENMIGKISSEMSRYGSGYSNWSIAMMHSLYPLREVVIAGQNANLFRQELQAEYLPNVLFAGSRNTESILSLLEGRYVDGKTLIYVCENKACLLPVQNSKEALKQLK